MATKYTYYKNSNTFDLIVKQEFTETRTKFPVYYYRDNKSIDTPDLKGYVEISEKKFKRESRKLTPDKTPN